MRVTVRGVAAAVLITMVAGTPAGAKLFKNQCAACHTLHAAEPKRQGPTLEGVVGRKAGAIADFHYSAA